MGKLSKHVPNDRPCWCVYLVGYLACFFQVALHISSLGTQVLSYSWYYLSDRPRWCWRNGRESNCFVRCKTILFTQGVSFSPGPTTLIFLPVTRYLWIEPLIPFPQGEPPDNSLNPAAPPMSTDCFTTSVSFQMSSHSPFRELREAITIPLPPRLSKKWFHPQNLHLGTTVLLKQIF